MKGIIFAMLTAFLMASMGAIAKTLSDWLTPLEITFWRNAIAALMLAIGFILLGHGAFLKTRNIKAQLIRALIGTCGMTLGMWAISLLPLSTVTAIRFSAPLLVLILSWPLLKEKVGPLRILATLVGLGGAIVIIDPFSLIGEPLPLKGVLVALAFTCFTAGVDLVLRWIGDKQGEPGMTTSFYFLFIGSVLTLPSLFLPESGSVQAIGSLNPLLMILAVGVVGGIGILFKSESFKLAPVAVISPIVYTGIIWTTLYDWLIWHNLPSINVYIGAGIIIAANFFVMWRERKKASVQKPVSKSPPLS